MNQLEKKTHMFRGLIAIEKYAERQISHAARLRS